MTSTNVSNDASTGFSTQLDSSAIASTSGNNTRDSQADQSSTIPWQPSRLLPQETKGTSNISNPSHSHDPGSDNEPRHARPRPTNLHLYTNARHRTRSPNVDDTEETEVTNEKPITWRSLPRKDQLLVLCLARFSEPLTQTSLGSYLYYQLQSFDPSLPDATISYQAGVMGAAFPASQFLTAILWGRFADSEHGGRKRVIYIGLMGTMLSMIGFGFSHSFATAVAFRCLGGVLNGNIGVMRTMISEIIKEKKYQSRAFLIMPMTFNIGVIIGPILGRSRRKFLLLITNQTRWPSCQPGSKLSFRLRSRLLHWW